MSEKTASSERAIRIFRAIVVIILGVLVGYFTYTTTLQSGTKYPFKYGLDLAGGSHLVYVADVSKIAQADVPSAMAVLRDVIERRTNVLGVSEPLVQVEQASIVSGSHAQRLIVELPGITDVETASSPLLLFLSPRTLLLLPIIISRSIASYSSISSLPFPPNFISSFSRSI